MEMYSITPDGHLERASEYLRTASDVRKHIISDVLDISHRTDLPDHSREDLTIAIAFMQASATMALANALLARS
jgi:hypothetical protein